MSQDHINASVGDPLDEIRRVIDRDIAQLEENIQALKSRRNELSPIYRLPPEILCNIFSFIEYRIMGQTPESWIHFSRVSQRWRSLALSAPELWTNIPLRYPRWTEEMLTRSKMAKLTIQADLSYQLSNSRLLDPIKACLCQMIRVGEIYVFAARGSTLEKLFQDLPKSAPQLHTICITSPSEDHIPGSAFTIHQDFLTDTERLQCVHLVNCKIGWDSRLLTGLTRLTLHDTLKGSANSSIIQFLDALQRMPTLINLDLEDSIPYDLKELSTYPVVDLPCLQVLRMSSSIGAVTTTLRHITFPSRAVLNLTCKEVDPTQIDFSNFLSVLVTKFLSSLVIRSLSLQDFDDSNIYKFQVWSTTVVQDLFPHSLLPPHLTLILVWLPPPPQELPRYAMALTTATFDAMDLRALTQLQLSTMRPISFKTWFETFARLPLLEQVRVNNVSRHLFLSALVYKTEAAEKSISAYHNVSFPKLRYICMNGIDFSGFSSMSLKDCLMERCERNAEIQELRLEDCYGLCKQEIETLREIVVDVDWDGVERLPYKWRRL